MAPTRYCQTTARHGHGVLRLPVSGAILSPFWHTRDLSRVGAGRNIKLFLNHMDFLIDSWGVTAGNPYAIISWWDNTNAFQSSDFIFMTFANVRTNGLSATIITAVNAYAAGHSLIVASIKGLPETLPGMPQAAIADAPADATTNYNTVTTLLGSLTGAVNTANTKQNDIATRLNSLFAELRTLGIIAT